MLILTRAVVFGALCFSLFAQQEFRILRAEYGVDNRWTDVTERVQNLVRGDGVEFRVDGETLIDPLPGVQKTLRIRYSYQGRMRTESFPDLANVRLGNPSRDFSRGNNAGGRFNRGGLAITRAEYGAGNRWADVTNLVSRSMQGGGVRMNVTNETMGGDPAPANLKSLRVEYRYEGQQRNLTVPEGGQLVLPEGSGNQDESGLRILDASYGVQGRKKNVTNQLNSALRNDRLNMRVSNANLGGDPYPGPDKELYVRYSYRGREYESYTQEGMLLNLPNENDRLVHGSSNSNAALQIESATWGSGNRTMDVTRELQGRMQNNRLSIRAENAMFSRDPAVGADKELVVRYRVANGSSQTIRVREGSTLNIP
ncbi:hypothetical protein [Bryobacter aggregatus]|uniref:hypothetical protein n=1 Tax=Bryobacter aggregatus TaxID=360054 RepID=UPI0004E27418|nr:hypothetical protein [Bryobacter aggregatus]